MEYCWTPQYSLGLQVGTEADRRKLHHGGAVSGFTSNNLVFPDDRASITVLTNDDGLGYGAAAGLTQRIVPLLFQSADANSEARAKKIFEGLQRGQIDRALLSENNAAYFSATALKDFATSLKPLGAPVSVQQIRQDQRGGMTHRVFSVTFKARKLVIHERDLADGTIEQFTVAE